MPKKFDLKVKEPCVHQILDHVADYANPSAVDGAIGRRRSVDGETVRHG